MVNKPHWERGYCSHGYWLDAWRRVGRVCLTPRCITLAYRASLTDGEAVHQELGEFEKLAQAKRAVEEAYRAISRTEEEEIHHGSTRVVCCS